MKSNEKVVQLGVRQNGTSLDNSLTGKKIDEKVVQAAV